jgi:hypothetical protein
MQTGVCPTRLVERPLHRKLPPPVMRAVFPFSLMSIWFCFKNDASSYLILTQGGGTSAPPAPPTAVSPLRETTIDTVIGPVIFDQKGDIKVPKYDIDVWKGGTYSKLTQ